MKKLRRPRFIFAMAVATALLIALPAGASAAETGAEAPVEPAPAPEASAPPVTAPGSTGWVPQSPSTGGSGGGSAPTQQGSSLGSGGSSHPAGSTGDEPVSGGDSSGPVEPEASPPPSPAPAPVEEPAGEPRAATRVEPVAPPPEPAPEPAVTGVAGLDDATLVARPEVATIDPASAVVAAPVSSSRDQGGSDSEVLPLPILILCGLFLIYAGARLVLGPVEPDLFRSKRFRFLRRAFDRT